jgi:hypothetical protein
MRLGQLERRLPEPARLCVQHWAERELGGEIEHGGSSSVKRSAISVLA